MRIRKVRENRSVTRHWTLCGKLQTRGKRLDERSYEDKIMQDMRKKRPLAETVQRKKMRMMTLK